MNFYEFLPKKLNFSEFIEIYANLCSFFDVFFSTWSLSEFTPGCTYTALLPGDVSSLDLEFTPGAGFSFFLPGVFRRL